MKHVLTNALGVAAKNVEPDVQRLALDDGDCVLLCTDGLSGLVDGETISQILNTGENSERTCQGLIDAALKAGGKDNVTAVVGRYRRQ